MTQTYINYNRPNIISQIFLLQLLHYALHYFLLGQYLKGNKFNFQKFLSLALDNDLWFLHLYS